jgi:DNA primase
MEKKWVDFSAVKQVVSMQTVLDHYQVKGLRKQGHELYGRCPIHKGEGADAFRVSVQKNAFNCFSCHARGNVLDFVAAMEKCSVRDAAIKLQEWFSVAVP